MKSFAVFAALAAVFTFRTANAQTDYSTGTTTTPEVYEPTYDPSANAYQQPSPMVGGETREPSPRIMDPNRPGYFQVGVGPGFDNGLGTDGIMYNVNASYNYNFDARLAGKILGDLALGSGSDSARWTTLGIGADYYLQEVQMGYGVPYAMIDLGYGMVRNDADRTKDAMTVGAGAGFKTSAADLNLDINLHYTLLTQELEGKNPSLLGLRAALAF